MDRRKFVEELKKQSQIVWDIIVIGGGATGLGIALDGASEDIKHYYWNRLILPRQPPLEVQNWSMEG